MEYMHPNQQDTLMKKAYLGLDVHKASIVIALALEGRSDPEIYGKAPSDLNSFLKILRRVMDKYQLTKEDIALCYEAGPTGFVLVRRLRELGFECEVVAPSLIPVRASDRVKTDRRDADQLARLYRAGELTAIHVPDPQDEAVRDLIRGRYQVNRQQHRAKDR